MRLVTLAWAAALLPLTAGLRLRGTASASSLAPHLAARASRGTRAIVLQAGSNGGGSAPDDQVSVLTLPKEQERPAESQDQREAQIAALDRQMRGIDAEIEQLRRMKKDLAAERREVTDVYDQVRFEVRNAQWNLPIVLTSCIAAFTAATWKYIVAVGSLYQNNDFMEADWLPESLSLSASIPYQLLAEYGHAAEAWPLLTMASTSGVAYIVGDVVAQRVEGRWRVGLLDLARTARAGALGFFLHGPLLSAWIRLLETTLFAGGAGDWSTLVAKIALDQTLFAATINLLYAFINALLNDKAPSEAAESARSLLVPSMLSSWRFWPAVHLISYSPLIPLDYKLLWIDVMEVVWVAILSALVNAKPEEGECAAVPWGEGRLFDESEGCPVPLEDNEDQRV